MPEFKKLKGIYSLLDRQTQEFSLACRDKCPDCCTVNVTVTSLEVAYIFSCLGAGQIRQVMGRLAIGFPKKKYMPGTTVNGFARACMAGEAMTEDENDPDWGACPLLAHGRCTIYDVRPLGCRVMVSETLCRKSGFARMPPFALTLSNVLAQALEQVDRKGFTGNFSDVLAAYARAWESRTGPEDRPLYLTLDNIPESDKTKVFLENYPVPALMIPPEHRDRAAPLVSEIRASGCLGK
jgi:Fe-S-cluster containining protein